MGKLHMMNVQIQIKIKNDLMNVREETGIFYKMF